MLPVGSKDDQSGKTSQNMSSHSSIYRECQSIRLEYWEEQEDIPLRQM
jgi:hypothetical protein